MISKINRKKKERKELEEALNARVRTADSNISYHGGSNQGRIFIRKASEKVKKTMKKLNASEKTYYTF